MENAAIRQSVCQTNNLTRILALRFYLGAFIIPKIGQMIRPKTVKRTVDGHTPKTDLKRKKGVFHENRIFKRLRARRRNR